MIAYIQTDSSNNYSIIQQFNDSDMSNSTETIIFNYLDQMSCKKTILQMISTLLLLVSLALIAAVVYGYINLQTFLNISGTQNIIIFAVIIAFVSFIFLTSVFGLVGSCKQNVCSLVCYIVVLILWMLFFVAIGVALILVVPQFIGGNCTSNSVFNTFNNFYTNASSNSSSICQSNCQCYFPTNLNTYSTAQQTTLLTTAPNRSQTNTALPVNAQGCLGWDDGSLPQGSTLFNFLETKFSCSGWCNTTLYYHFSNVNNGIPADTCYNVAGNLVKLYGQIVYIVSFVIAGIILLTWLMAWCFINQINQRPLDVRKPIEYTDRQNRY